MMMMCAYEYSLGLSELRVDGLCTLCPKSSRVTAFCLGLLE